MYNCEGSMLIQERREDVSTSQCNCEKDTSLIGHWLNICSAWYERAHIWCSLLVDNLRPVVWKQLRFISGAVTPRPLACCFVHYELSSLICKQLLRVSSVECSLAWIFKKYHRIFSFLLFFFSVPSLLKSGCGSEGLLFFSEFFGS